MKGITGKVKKNAVGQVLIFLILFSALWIRVFRLDKTLGFWYDQGRDALVIWDLIHNGKFFLIGPTTGLAGIFRGPYYYYLITPFYFLGRGNPVWPAVFLVFLSVAAIFLLYRLASNIGGKTAGLIAAIIASFSFNIFNASRWLSNPTPMLLFSMILVWAMIKVTEGKKWGWPIIALISGLSLFNFGSSGELFYFPALLVFLAWQWGKRPDLKNTALSLFLFFLTFAPLVFFDARHQHILLANLTTTFGAESGSFSLPNVSFILGRLSSYLNIFAGKIFAELGNLELFSLAVVALIFLFSLLTLWKSTKVKVILLLLASPILGFLFYRGNYGVLYDYYMTGYYLIFVLLFAVVLAQAWGNRLGKVFVLFFLVLFFANNAPPLASKIGDTCDGPQAICLLNQKQAIDWIYSEADGKDFNVDVYVPPVIPYAYDYLFTWLGNTKYGKFPLTSNVPCLYTLYEVDSPHPERLEAWLARQEGIGTVVDSQSFGGITVEERQRIIK